MAVDLTVSGQQITEADRDEWLKVRQSSIGSSEAPAVLGASQYETPIEVWQRKTGRAREREDTEPMLWGRLLEPVLAAEYQRRTGRALVGSQVFLRHDERPWMTATLDGLGDDGRIVELKTASAWAKEWGDEASDQVPEPYLVQVHHQMAVAGASVADVAVLIGGQRFQVYTVERNEDLISLIIETEERFWRCVERRTPPSWGRLDAAGLAMLHPECQGSITFDAEASVWIREYEEAQAAKKAAEEQAERAKLQILEAMGSAQLGRLPDGRVIKRFREDVAERMVSYTSKPYVKHYFKVLKGDSK